MLSRSYKKISMKKLVKIDITMVDTRIPAWSSSFCKNKTYRGKVNSFSIEQYAWMNQRTKDT